ncbi:NAD binding domain of 6-phosphogluconate dehydrogenase-domain-containing protein [Lophiotrema nucula]|uniref:3-hydroxyisobutyrate dehydrogenase n=1 Tax=Lophiotrema nucula TaxID=690887 RepID=A0A6A5ZRA6_9PLEO|nr:NAD binding domain of 6-phosphogluconate dehydrogenase-domain-containing protein [Lophiotrema nucula]
MRAVSRLASPLLRGTPRAVNIASRRCFSSSQGLQATWGFIGLGRMGYPMAKNLRAKIPAEDVLFINDVNKAAAAQFLEENPQGVRIADTVREVAEKAETIITSLPEPQHVAGVFHQMLSPPTLLKDGFSNQQRLFIDVSTIDPMTSKSVADAAHMSGQGKFIDAPMSGGVVGAKAGTLTFMIGASEDIVERATQVLSLMGKRVLHLGEQGSGLKGKLANNYLLALNNIATAEAMNMGVQWGLDPKALAGMINISTGKCWPSEVNNPVPGVIEGSPASRGYEGGFGIGLANKDLKLAIKACKEAGIKLALGDSAKAFYDEVAAAENCKGRDFSVVYRYLGGKE